MGFNGINVTDSKVVRRYKCGYEIREEYWDIGSGDKTLVRQCYTPDGKYIGSKQDAHYLCYKRGIAPTTISKKHDVCTIGFCEKEQKWYGWSHRSMFGFGIGDKIFEERYGSDSTHFARHGKKKIKTLADARLAASRFARSVS